MHTKFYIITSLGSEQWKYFPCREICVCIFECRERNKICVALLACDHVSEKALMTPVQKISKVHSNGIKSACLVIL